MREYVLSQALSCQSLGYMAMAKRIVRNWKQHRELEHLLTLDTYLLADLGLSHAIVRQLAALPLTTDVDWERERLHKMR
jgi:uncharacterized protein YjiS (DUF1127 family)